MKNVSRVPYDVVNAFADAAWAHDKNFNFCAGVLESVLVSALEQLPKGKREALMDRLVHIQDKYFAEMKMDD